MQMRFTDTHTVFIFILVSFYRTFLRFPHRLTIPAYEIRSHCITCIICFLVGDIQAPRMPAQFINRIADLERFWEASAVPMLFAVPGLCVLPATATGNYFSLLL